MSIGTPQPLLGQPGVVYPETDGEPMAENTRQFRWIVTIQGGLDALFRDDPNVFVAGDLFWYPVEGNNKLRVAPDVMVVFGRPKGDRGSYLQWLEDDIAPQVVFEVLSPGNRPQDIVSKFGFYERYGVDEYYMYDPDNSEPEALSAWTRKGALLEPVERPIGFVSPRLKVRFGFENGELVIYRPDGCSFSTYLELAEGQERERAEKEGERAQKERARERAERLAAQLRQLGVEPEA